MEWLVLAISVESFTCGSLRRRCRRCRRCRLIELTMGTAGAITFLFTQAFNLALVRVVYLRATIPVTRQTV